MANIISTCSPEFAERQAYRNSSEYTEIWELLDQVCDPELPGLTIWDLGILQDVQLVDDIYTIVITPTYSGCPAVDAINQDVTAALKKAGYKNIVKVTFAPAWTTEMMSPAGKAHLKSIQIAPPDENDKVVCPVCDSESTKLISQFGSTACKSLYQCSDCHESFDYFKHF